VDGGVVCDVPAEPLRWAGAGRIIAVELGSHLPETPPSNMLEVLSTSLAIAVLRHAEDWRKVTDVLIQPRVGDFAYDDFAHAEALIAAGRAAAEAALPAVLQLAGLPPSAPGPTVAVPAPAAKQAAEPAASASPGPGGGGR
jgi:NTE family protein